MWCLNKADLIRFVLFVSASEKMQRKLRQRLKQQQFQHLMQNKQLQQQAEITSPGETAPLGHTDGIQSSAHSLVLILVINDINFFTDLLNFLFTELFIFTSYF